MLMSFNSQPKEPAVRALFSRIASRYDLLNRLMTFGQDISWRKQAIRLLKISGKVRVLDAGTGTGDVALAIAKMNPEAFIVGLDLTPGMLSIAKRRSDGKRIHWVIADAQDLPFRRSVFDRVISAFLLRNVTHINSAIAEQARVLAKGGQIVALETTPPRKSWLRPVALLQLRLVIPWLGRLVAGDAAAYQYLPRSIEEFISGEQIAMLVEGAGFNEVNCRYRMMDTVSIVTGQRIVEDNEPDDIP